MRLTRTHILSRTSKSAATALFSWAVYAMPAFVAPSLAAPVLFVPAFAEPGVVAPSFPAPAFIDIPHERYIPHERREPHVGEITGDRTGTEGEALAFGVFIYGFEETPHISWDFGDGSDPVSGVGLSRTSHEYLDGPNNYTVTVQVAGEVSISRTMAVTISNGAPVIDFMEAQPDPQLALPVEFRATATDPGDDDIQWTWNFGDGSAEQTGSDLGKVSHRYESNGHYEVTLTVSDGTASSSRTVHVYVGMDFVARTSGEMSDTLQGMSGAANFFAGSMFAASPMPRVSVGRTNDYCMVIMGFWDDEHKVHVNFLWTPSFDRVFKPGEFPVVDSRSEKPGANQMQIQLHYMPMGDSYAEAKGSAASGAGETSNRAAIMGRVIGNIFSMGRNTRNSSEDNLMTYSRGGTVRITHASADQIRGTFTTQLDGVTISGRSDVPVNMEGQFVFRPVSDQTGEALKGCAGARPFSVEEHSPQPNERFVSFMTPNVVIAFTRQFRPASVTSASVQFGYLDDAGLWRQVDADVAVDADARHVKVTPREPLKAMVYYRVRVSGGANGVLAEGGEQLPDGLYEWRFATQPRNVPGARGGGG